MDRLHSSPELLRRVEAAERLGISLRRFDGWEPVTSYAYDDNGRIVSSAPETEWDEEQQAYMLALAHHRKLTCQSCGGWLPDTTEAEAEDAYVAELERCHSCVALDIGVTQARTMPHPSALRLQVSRRE